MGDVQPSMAAALQRDEQGLNGFYAGFKASRGSLSFDHPVVQVDGVTFNALVIPMLAHGLNAVRECSSCGHLMLLTSGTQKGPETCECCRLAEQRDRKRRWRSENPSVIESRSCVVCGTVFTPKRSDAKCCSGKCRTKLSRQEAKQQG
jgi:hypothetical protein